MDVRSASAAGSLLADVLVATQIRANCVMSHGKMFQN